MTRKNQAGMASIVIVSVLVIILTLISVGFARLMGRSLGDTVNNQLGSGAYYAARSAINDAATYLAANPTTTADACDDLLGAGKPLQSASDGFSSASDGVVKYTCILVDQNPKELNYQKIDAFKSQVVKLDPAGSAITSLQLSWQASEGDGIGSPNTQLRTQTTWANSGYEPVLRISIYPVANNTDSLANVEGRARTFFLYPVASGGSATLSFGSGNGTLHSTPCNPSSNYHCDLTITNLAVCGGDCEYFYARITPLYAQTDVKIKGNNGSVEFTGAQASIDATAKSNSSTRRLLAKVDISAGNITPADEAIPEYAIRTAATLCKRINVSQSGGNPVNGIDVSAQAYCNLTLN